MQGLRLDEETGRMNLDSLQNFKVALDYIKECRAGFMYYQPPEGMTLWTSWDFPKTDLKLFQNQEFDGFYVTCKGKYGENLVTLLRLDSEGKVADLGKRPSVLGFTYTARTNFTTDTYPSGKGIYVRINDPFYRLIISENVKEGGND